MLDETVVLYDGVDGFECPLGLEFGAWQCSIEEYHADTRYVSATSLETFFESPAQYHGQFIARTIDRKETKSLRLGNAVHSRVLEPDDFIHRYTKAPGIGKRSKAGRAIREDLAAQGMIVLESAEWDLAHWMADSILAHPKAREIIRAADRREYGVRWRAPNGIACKTRFDLLADQIIGDLKTSRHAPSPDRWRREVANWGYHRQAAFYRLAHDVVFGCAADHCHIVVHSEAPFEAAVYRLDEESLGVGHVEVLKSLDDLALCRGLGVWTADWQRGVRTVSLPRYAKGRK